MHASSQTAAIRVIVLRHLLFSILPIPLQGSACVHVEQQHLQSELKCSHHSLSCSLMILKDVFLFELWIIWLDANSDVCKWIMKRVRSPQRKSKDVFAWVEFGFLDRVWLMHLHNTLRGLLSTHTGCFRVFILSFSLFFLPFIPSLCHQLSFTVFSCFVLPFCVNMQLFKLLVQSPWNAPALLPPNGLVR